MVELAILSGRRASEVISIDCIPCTLGRAKGGIELDEPGVAPQHATIFHDPATGFHLRAVGEATVYSGGLGVHDLRLRNGQLFELGGLRLQFRLQASKARNWAWLELLSAAAVAACCGAELLWIFISPSWP